MDQRLLLDMGIDPGDISRLADQSREQRLLMLNRTIF
jgi:hypothetical protein